MNEFVLVSIHDKVSEYYTPPMAFINKKVAGRYFNDLVKNNNNASHYSLVFIGVFNNLTADISSKTPVVVIDGDNIIDLDFSCEAL